MIMTLKRLFSRVLHLGDLGRQPVGGTCRQLAYMHHTPSHFQGKKYEIVSVLLPLASFPYFSHQQYFIIFSKMLSVTLN